VWAYVDFTRLAQAVSNLMNNAVKFTPRGGRIILRAVLSGDVVMVSVTDTGVGIAPSALPNLFDMFMRNDEHGERPRDGLGIGLTLARRLIELHEGTIEAMSDGPGTGATFIIRLPLVPATLAPARSADTRA
jgi:signal transduction histidine kinase